MGWPVTAVPNTGGVAWNLPSSTSISLYRRHRMRQGQTYNRMLFETHVLIDWVGSHPTQNRSFHRRSSQLIFRLSNEKWKQTQQKQAACINNNIYYNIKLTQKSKVRFGHLLWPLAWKKNRSILYVLYRMVAMPMTLSDPNHPNFYVLGLRSYLWNGEAWHFKLGVDWHSGILVHAR